LVVFSHGVREQTPMTEHRPSAGVGQKLEALLASRRRPRLTSCSRCRCFSRRINTACLALALRCPGLSLRARATPPFLAVCRKKIWGELNRARRGAPRQWDKVFTTHKSFQSARPRGADTRSQVSDFLIQLGLQLPSLLIGLLVKNLFQVAQDARL
jgi:hypothetical protein